MILPIELKEIEEPLVVSGAVVGSCFLVRKLTGFSLGIECNTLEGAVKAFILILATGGIVKYKYKEDYWF